MQQRGKNDIQLAYIGCSLILSRGLHNPQSFHGILVKYSPIAHFPLSAAYFNGKVLDPRTRSPTHWPIGEYFAIYSRFHNI